MTFCVADYTRNAQEVRSVPTEIPEHDRGPFRYLTNHMNEAARQRARDLWTTPEFKYAQRQRKKVEALFAELKSHIGPRRLRLRRLKFVREQFSWRPLPRTSSDWSGSSAGQQRHRYLPLHRYRQGRYRLTQLRGSSPKTPESGTDFFNTHTIQHFPAFELAKMWGIAQETSESLAAQLTKYYE